MGENVDKNKTQGGAMDNVFKSWVMVILTIIFVSLYAAALTGWLKPLADVTMITRLEPIIFVIIGYYFGRLPAQATEKTLKEEIDRQTKKTDALQHSKEAAEKEREVIEEKIKNAKIALGRVERDRSGNGDGEAAFTQVNARATGSVATAIRILDS
jgi:hypothetical protein